LFRSAVSRRLILCLDGHEIHGRGSIANFRKVPVLGGTNLRRGGSAKGDPAHDNLIGSPGVVAAGNYTAFAQCAGQQATDQGNTNFWWVLVETPHGTGWVSAVRVDEGGNNQPIDGVRKAATVFEAAVPGGPHKKIQLVPGGGRIRRGGSTKSDPDNTVTTVEGNTCPALVQCAGQDVSIGGAKNFWWVLIDTPEGQGWISAVLIDEGGNDEPIEGVPIAPTVFVRPS
jgi:hypothetical protein